MKMCSFLFKRKKGNKGSTLVMVIFCMLLFSTIGITLLSTTVVNLKMKQVASASTSNFYTTEQELDKFVINLETSATEVLRETYADVLQNYIAISEASRKEYIESQFAANVMSLVSDVTKLQDIADKSGISINNITNVASSVVREGNEIVIKGISVTYKDDNDYETTITTDLRISTKAGETLSAGSSDTDCYGDFVIIADGKTLNNDNGITRTITGNIYSGEGVEAVNSSTELKIRASKLISRGSIVVDKKAKMDIAGLTGAGNCEVWIENFEMNETVKSNPSAGDSDELVVNADCYVKDDLTFNSDYANAKFTGSYTGFSVMGFEDKASESSSIAINSHNITLDMSAAKLVLAGNAYISVPNIYGSDTISASSETSFMEGDSLTYKAGQTAYLVPGECLTGIGHNPMTTAEFARFGSTIPNFSAYSLGGTGAASRTLADYAEGYKAVTVRYANNSQMVYLYIKFKDMEGAAEFYRRYYATNRDLVESQIKLMGGETSITLNNEDGQVTTIGNIVTYSADDGMQLTESNSTAAYMTKENTKNINKYSAYINGLSESIKKPPTAKLTNNIVNYSYLNSIVADGTEYEFTSAYNIGIADTYVLLARKDIELNASKVNGKRSLIVCDGDVVLDNCNFNGLIICSGNVTLKGSCNATYASTGISGTGTSIEDIVSACSAKDPSFPKLFYGAGTVGGSSSADDAAEAVKIKYENWHKN